MEGIEKALSESRRESEEEGNRLRSALKES
jgi:hypothetical protein